MIQLHSNNYSHKATINHLHSGDTPVQSEQRQQHQLKQQQRQSPMVVAVTAAPMQNQGSSSSLSSPAVRGLPLFPPCAAVTPTPPFLSATATAPGAMTPSPDGGEPPPPFLLLGCPLLSLGSLSPFLLEAWQWVRG
ncbi:uncharacterized protein DS421_7g200420 [Arachis hypogaea]|nr:uncharacterized protein DS421_7g200420 [Arachis hypogaea]